MSESTTRRCCFLDTSALAKLVVREAGSEQVRALHDAGAAHLLATTRLAPVELAAALQRRVRAGDVSLDAAVASAKAILDLVEARYHLVEVSSAVSFEACQWLSLAKLSPVDAIHLAAAHTLSRARKDLAVVLVSSDLALNEAARKRGLEVRDPAAW